ncbi:MAG: cadmium-translocating P-type ATPase [Anaerolineales bacterium]|nr:cadmium-translocating P-type ATPase [Anaerolineales bacterium]
MNAELLCSDILPNLLRGQPGIQTVEYDYRAGKLKAAFNPRELDGAKALEAVHAAGREAATRISRRAAECQHGGKICPQCSSGLAAQLASQSQAAATLPAADFGEGTLEATLNAEGENPIQVKAEAREIPKEKIEAAFTAVNAVATLSAIVGASLGWNPVLIVALYVVAYGAGGWFGLLASVEALKEKTLNVDLLMILAALGAAAISQPAEGAILLFLFSLSNTLQAYAMDRSRKAIEKLLDLRPKQATARRGARWVTLPVEQLIVGDTVLIRPGERFPTDGEVAFGESDVNQATITGESLPVHKEIGDSVFAGTVNGNGSLEARVTRLATDSTLARIVKMVEEAQANKANTQQALDVFEQKYAFFVLAASAALIIVPFFFLGHAFQPTFYRAMTWLVVASPCALVISTPASILSAIANGARNGVLFKGGAHLERTASLKALAFDKTGTLTSGKPSLTEIRVLETAEISEEDLLRLAAALESRSEHPLAQAIVKAAQTRTLAFPQPSSFRAIPGQGVEGVAGGRELWIGNQRLFAERGASVPQGVLEQVRALQADGQTAMLVYDAAARRFLGLLGVADTLRDDAVEMIQALKKLGVQHIVMLTGDNEQVAAKVAARAGVDEFYADLLPQDKVEALKALQKKYGAVGMVGDGVNDAPSLATADIGIAMGGAGTDVAIETADVVLMSDDLRKIPFSIGLARQARKVVWQNLTFAMAVIVTLVITTFGANLLLPLGVVGHEGSTVIVVLNGLRLLGYKGEG